jgi:phage terminase small subunit
MKWLEIIGEIDGRDQGTLDLAVLYATEWARWCHAESEVGKIGEVVRSPQGYPQANPWLSIARQAFDRLVKLSKRLGIDPQ